MMRKTTAVMLENAECAGGSAHIVEKVLREVPGVLFAYVNPATEAAYVEYDADRCSETDLEGAVESLGIRNLHTAPRQTASRKPAFITVPSQRLPMRDTGTRSRTWWAFAGFVAIAGFFLVTEHRAHLFGVWPFLFLLACPFLHRFGHGGNGGHGGHGGRGGNGGHGGHAADAQEGDARDRDQAARAGNYEQSSRWHQHLLGATRGDGRSQQ
jgi:copper chaperone CopZ